MTLKIEDMLSAGLEVSDLAVFHLCKNPLFNPMNSVFEAPGLMRSELTLDEDGPNIAGYVNSFDQIEGKIYLSPANGLFMINSFDGLTSTKHTLGLFYVQQDIIRSFWNAHN